MQPTALQFTMFINLILQSAFLFAPTRSWDLYAIKSAAEFGLVFFQDNGTSSPGDRITKILTT